MSREITPTSRAEELSEIGAVEGPGGRPRRADRQRGRWNFLTWSFFLAEVAAGAQFLGTGAKAAEAGDSEARSKAHSDAAFDGILGSPPSGIMAGDNGEGRADASQPKTQSAEANLNFIGLQQDDEPGAPLSNAEFGGFTGASSSGSGASGSGSNGTSQVDPGGPSEVPGSPPGEPLPPISEGPPSGAWPPVSGGGPPFEIWPPISDGPPSGALPPIFDDPSTGLLPPITVGGTVSVVLDTTLGLVGTVGGVLGDVVDGTLGQITGLVGNAGELTAVLGGLLDSELNSVLSATNSLVPQSVGSVVSSVGSLASSVTELGLLGDSGQLSSDGTVSQFVYTASSQLVDDAGNILNELTGDQADAVNMSDMAPLPLDILSDPPEIAALAHDQDVSSGGTIAFPDLASAKVLQVNELFSGGQYTDYGLAVQSEGNSGAATIADTLNGDADNSTLNTPVDSPIDSHESALSPGVPDVNTSSVSLPVTFEELGGRDHLSI